MTTRATAWPRASRIGSAVVLAAMIAIPPAAQAATRHVGPAGADAGDCLSAACRSTGYAYQRSAPGDVIEVAGGSYGSQTIPVVAGRPAPAVTIRPAPGASVSFGELNIRGSHVLVRDIATGFVDISAGQTEVADVTVIGARGPGAYLNRVRDVTFKGGSFGPYRDKPMVQIGGNPGSVNITFDGVDFHDATASTSGVHMECMWAGGVQGLTVRNSLFRNCAHFDIFLTRLNGPDPRNVLLENNVFEAPKQPLDQGGDAPYAVMVAEWVSRIDDYTFRNNTFDADLSIQPSAISNMTIAGNLGPIMSCTRGVAYSHNVFESKTCSPTDKRSGRDWLRQFVDPANHDWHLRPGAIAIDAADPGNAPATDRDGKRRTAPPDAGAYEYGDPPTAGPPVTGKPVARRGPKLKVRPSHICHPRRRGCPATARVRVTSARGAKLALRLARKGARRDKLVRVKHKRARKRTTVFKISARGLRPGRYRVKVIVRRPGHKPVTLRKPLRVS